MRTLTLLACVLGLAPAGAQDLAAGAVPGQTNSTPNSTAPADPWHQTTANLPVDDGAVGSLVLEVDLGPDTLICDGGALVLDVTTPGATYLWSDGSSGPTLLAELPGTYHVRVSLGASSSSDTIILSGGTPPVLDLPEHIGLCPGGSIELNVHCAGAKVLWMDGETMPVRTVKEAGTYSVTVTNACGSRSATVEVLPDHCPCVPFLPNAFTPNGDGINDVVGPAFQCGSGTVSWAVFDRWGSLVFQAPGLNARWDGTIGGQPVAEATYVWQAIVRGSADADAVYMGQITVIR
jgi:gliding motility-associated-like protein